MVTPKVDFNRALGEHIRRAREGRGVKQEQLALAVGLTRTSITNIERGRQGVHAYLLARIAEVLRVPTAELLPSLTPEPSIPDRVKELAPSKRAWAERVMRQDQDDDHAA